jgi:rhomboid protease GluP
MNDDSAQAVQIFHGRWRSTLGGIALTLMLLTLIMFVLALGSRGTLAWLPSLTGVSFGWLAWALGKPLFTRTPIVRIGPRGISGFFLKNHTIPWHDLQSVSVESVQGQQMLVLHLLPNAKESLAKTRPLLSGREPKRIIPLNGLPSADQPGAVLAVQTAFAWHAAANAEAAQTDMRKDVEIAVAFEQTLLAHTRMTWALYFVVALNVGVWIWNVTSGISPTAPEPMDLFRSGASSAWAVSHDQEYSRLITAIFLHGGIFHLAMNMLGLWEAGRLLNRMQGNAQFLLIYLGSGLAGAALSLHFGAQTAVSVGASGSVFGVLGALFVTLRRHRTRLPPTLGKGFVTAQGVFIAYALIQGFARQGVDNAAHVGGLVAGALLAWLLADGVDEVLRARQRWFRAGAGATAVAAAVVLLVVATPAPRVDHRAVFASVATFDAAISRWRFATQAMQRSADELKAGRLTEQALVDAIAKTHLPATRAAERELAAARAGQGNPIGEVIADMQQLAAKTVQVLELQLRIERGEAPAEAAKQVEHLINESAAITRRLNARAEQAKHKPKS